MGAVTAVLLFVAAFEGVFAKLSKYGELHGLKDILADPDLHYVRCHAHTDCHRNEYCDTQHDCWDRQSCFNYNDAVDGQCPQDTEHCDTHDDCKSTEYCNRSNNCYENEDGECEYFMDPVDGWCPEYKVAALGVDVNTDITHPCEKLNNHRHSYVIVEAKHDLCPGEGVCCQFHWRSDCAEGCARNICLDNGGKWVNHGDYDHHPYMCEVSSDDGDNKCGWAAWDCVDCVGTRGCVYVEGSMCLYGFGKKGRAATAAGNTKQDCGQTNEGCRAHTDCHRNEYCDTQHDCRDWQSCFNYNDPVDGQCPRGERCDTHDDCKSTEYCDRNHNCYENEDGECEEHMDPVDGRCPEYKGRDTENTTM